MTGHEGCATCDALIAAVAELVSEHSGLLPTSEELAERADVSLAALVAHVRDAAGAYVCGFEAASERLLEQAERDMRGPGTWWQRLERAVHQQLATVGSDPMLLALVGQATIIKDRAVWAATMRMRTLYTEMLTRVHEDRGEPELQLELMWSSLVRQIRALLESGVPYEDLAAMTPQLVQNIKAFEPEFEADAQLPRAG